MIVRLSVIFLLFSISWTAAAIDPNLASFTVSKKNGVWMLEMTCASKALQQAVSHHEMEAAKPTSDNSNFKEAALTYLLSTILIEVNSDITISLSESSFKLGANQCNAKFQLSGMPEEITEMKVMIKSMSENADHVNLVKVFVGEDIRRLLLDPSNQFEQTIDFTEQIH